MIDAKFNLLFGKNLKQLRESIGETRPIFASRFNCSAYTLQSYEAGTRSPNFKRFLHICNTLKISPNQLLYGLYPWPTELDDLQELEHIMVDIDGAAAKRLNGVQEILLKCLLEASPKLTGASFGVRLHILRVDAELEIEALAKRCMIAVSTIQGYESGQYAPSIPVVLSLSQIFCVSPEYLLAPELEQLFYPDDRIAFLRPREIKALLEMTWYGAKNF